MLPGQIVFGNYDLRLVLISAFIAITASYATVDCVGRIRLSERRGRLRWIASGAFAMGTGIWAMHYVGIFALRLPVFVEHDWALVLLSMFVSIGTSAVSLSFIGRPVMRAPEWVVGSAALGGGVSAMHYTGIAAMTGSLDCVFNVWLVSLSVILAVGLSYLALKLASTVHTDFGQWTWSKLRASSLMGMAIVVMHYVGMSAATFVWTGRQEPINRRAIGVSSLALTGIVAVTLIILGLTILTSSIDRRMYWQSGELQRNQNQLKAIFENMTEGIVVIDREFNILQSNSVAARILELPSRSVKVAEVHSLFDTLRPDGTILNRDEVPSSRAFKEEFLTNCKLKIRRRDTGKSVTVEVTTRPLRYSDEGLQEVMVCYRDITDREEMESARLRLAAIVNGSEDAIIGKTEEGIITSWNLGAEKIFGYSSAEMVGQSIRILLPPGREDEEDNILAQIKRNELVEHFETVRRKKTGELIDVSLTISPIRDATGHIIGASKICRDITSTKMLEKQLRQSQKMEAIGQLTGGIAHDFNNLLGVVIGNLDLLEQLVADFPAALKRTRGALRAASRGAELTRRLLAFSNREEPAPAPTSILEPINNVLELSKRVIGPQISIRSEFDVPDCQALVDPARLENAILNLVLNARDAMPQGGNITIHVKIKELDDQHPLVRASELMAGAYARISVADTGTGMDRDVLEKAFEPFFTTKSRERGTGLGLSMVYGFTKQSGGAARIYSELDRGTTVSLYFPIARSFTAVHTKVSDAHEQVIRPMKIMVVDDEEGLLEIASEYLREMKHTVVQARSGLEAMEKFQHDPGIELVITDVIMPGGISGVELVRQLRIIRPELKFLFTSGFSADALSYRDDQVPQGPLLEKPYQRSDLSRALKQCLEMSL